MCKAPLHDQAGLDIIDDTRLKIDIERMGDVFASAGLREGGETSGRRSSPGDDHPAMGRLRQ